MYADLLPEFVGLLLTPAAVVGCILLLQSSRPYTNAFAFALAFVVLYGAISIAVLAIGDAVEPTADASNGKGVASITVGALFLLGGTVVALHHRQTREGPPKWATLLEHAQPTGAFIAGFVLALANPNIFLLLSGLAIVVSEAASHGDRVWGVLFLLLAVVLDFLVPVVLFAAFGARARRWLEVARDWMIRHDRQLTLALLFGFGGLFLLRGLNALL